MSKFCTQCGNEIEDEDMFCSACGSPTDPQAQHNKNQQNINQNQYVNEPKGPCVKCGSLTPFSSNLCNSCGEVNPHKPKESHSAAIVLGYIFSLFVPIVGIIFAIYLLTRENLMLKNMVYSNNYSYNYNDYLFVFGYVLVVIYEQL
ncbi:zinc ribbon domain-containing protein [Methanobrevibacter arboriphilus]|uniref:zinc ribbon domain-containing protein n=1 Tax=Methanobrevibacter arboriphilus TaxID=39441 RepID=UPI001CDB27F6|nr:zinc ribbon domain-containing protein [Methanobrevibacter arboriphilus]